MPFTQDGEVTLRRFGARSWRLAEPLIYEGEQDVITIPRGYATDLASVPRFLHWLVSPYGPYTRAAVLHDYLITDAIPLGLSSRDADGMFRRVMREEGTGFALRWLMWAAVRAAAAFNPARGEVGRDWFAILGIGLLALPIYPAALAVLVTLAVLRPFEGRGRW